MFERCVPSTSNAPLSLALKSRYCTCAPREEEASALWIVFACIAVLFLFVYYIGIALWRYEVTFTKDLRKLKRKAH